ncbi:PQQ-binding-like beta-propeller repeat protein [Planctobacterium marinum]|uniref:Pyrrolo-quinoline quinone repeat domain-containing protein n=1 Tax=Planctobacterium marinum TaxID=1631968 RepID=A0AA48HNJ1_9ALTE|nr:hypothetical protein MACH26_13080 [Planctobacterium marinum]
MKKIFLGIKGHVVCLNQDSGEEQWRTKIKNDWGKPTVVVYSEDLIVYLNGTLYCICPDGGKIKWENPLKGLGNGNCVISLTGKAALGKDGSEPNVIVGEIIDTAIDMAM